MSSYHDDGPDTKTPPFPTAAGNCSWCQGDVSGLHAAALERRPQHLLKTCQCNQPSCFYIQETLSGEKPNRRPWNWTLSSLISISLQLPTCMATAAARSIIAANISHGLNQPGENHRTEWRFIAIDSWEDQRFNGGIPSNLWNKAKEIPVHNRQEVHGRKTTCEHVTCEPHWLHGGGCGYPPVIKHERKNHRTSPFHDSVLSIRPASNSDLAG